jgi:predicted transcriptional regulator YdeE
VQKEKVILQELKLVGITTRTNNAAEMDPIHAKVGITVDKYFQDGLAEKIEARKTPGTTYCVYIDYQSDFTGDYTFFIGEVVTEVANIIDGYTKITIPSQNYIKFTTNKGIMPAVCINAWQQIWNMAPAELGGARAYIADFEVYDQRSVDPNNTILDLYIGVKK